MPTTVIDQPPYDPGAAQSSELQAWLTRLEKNHPVEIDLGLDRISQVAERLGLARPARRVVTVAGTNGKGSCVRSLEQLLLAGGERVGTYTSPHLRRYNERIRIQGREVEDAAICAAFSAIEAARGDISLTYFEVGTLAALVLMAAADLDVAVLEVGLGGRFDAVNLIAADIAVITPIDIDHSHWLGTTREQIGLEKAGIARPGAKVVIVDEQPPASLVNDLQQRGCQTYYLQQQFSYQSDRDHFSVVLAAPNKGADTVMASLPLPALPLPSVVAALQAVQLLGIKLSSDQVSRVCGGLFLPGRYQQMLFRQRRVILDVAHNPAAAAYLRRRLEERGECAVALVVAMMGDKDASGFVATMAPIAKHWYVGNLSGIGRALDPEQLVELVYTAGQKASCWSDIGAAFHAAIDATPVGELVVVCGSFFTVAAISDIIDH